MEEMKKPIMAGPRRKWNWAAFTNPIFFAIGNKSYLGLLNLIPIFNLVWCFIYGAKAEAWTWETGLYEDDKTFRASMDSWNRAGLVFFIITIALTILSCIFASTLSAKLVTILSKVSAK